jgi:hypothetical protein
LATSLAEKAFLSTLWARYQDFASWWRLQPGIAGDFHDWIRLCDATMIKLEPLAAKLGSSTKASSQDMLDASVLATDAYKLAEMMASQANYGVPPGFKVKIDSVGSMGIITPENVAAPIYNVVTLLAAAAKRGDTLTADQQALVKRPANAPDHADALNKVP